MTYQPLVPGNAPDTSVLKGNPWTQPIALPTTDTAGNPINWAASTFTVTSAQTALITLTRVSTTSLLLTLTGIQTAAMTVRYIHWYLADDLIMNDEFLTGRVLVKDKQ